MLPPHGLSFCDIETSSRSTLVHINHSKQTLERAIRLYNTGRIISIHTNFVTLTSCAGRRKPSISGLFRILHARVSTQRMYNRGDRESPCLTPRDRGIVSDNHSFTIMRILAPLYKVLIQKQKDGPKPKRDNKFSKKVRLTRSKAFYNNNNNI